MWRGGSAATPCGWGAPPARPRPAARGLRGAAEETRCLGVFDRKNRDEGVRSAGGCLSARSLWISAARGELALPEDSRSQAEGEPPWCKRGPGRGDGIWARSLPPTPHCCCLPRFGPKASGEILLAKMAPVEGLLTHGSAGGLRPVPPGSRGRPACALSTARRGGRTPLGFWAGGTAGAVRSPCWRRERERVLPRSFSVIPVFPGIKKARGKRNGQIIAKGSGGYGYQGRRDEEGLGSLPGILGKVTVAEGTVGG